MKPMTGLTKPLLVLTFLTMNACSGLNGLGANGTAIDRLKPDAVGCANALASDIMPQAREACLVLLERLGAAANW